MDNTFERTRQFLIDGGKGDEKAVLLLYYTSSWQKAGKERRVENKTPEKRISKVLAGAGQYGFCVF